MNKNQRAASAGEKNFRLISVPYRDANYSHALFCSGDLKHVLKVGPSSKTYITGEVSQQLDMCYDLGRKLHDEAPEVFPEVRHHIEGIVFLDFSPISHDKANRQPEPTLKNRQRLVRLTDTIAQQKRELHLPSGSFGTSFSRNQRSRLEEQRASQHDEIRNLERLEAALHFLLSVCDMVQQVHDQKELHLEVNLTSVGLGQNNALRLLPSLPYASENAPCRRYFTEGLSGYDIVAPELLRDEPPTQATDVYLIAKTFCQYLILLNDSSSKTALQVHELQLVKNCIPGTVADLVPILEKSLSSDQNARPQTPADLAECITNAFAKKGEGKSVDRESKQDNVQFRAKPKFGPGAIVLGIALLLVLIAGINSMFGKKAPATRELAELPKVEEELEREPQEPDPQFASAVIMDPEKWKEAGTQKKSKPNPKPVSKPPPVEPIASLAAVAKTVVVSQPPAEEMLPETPPVTKKAPPVRQKATLGTEMKSGNEYRRDIEVLLVRGLAAEPQRGADIYGIDFPRFLYIGSPDKAEELQKSLVWREYVDRITNAGRLATSVVKKSKDELRQQYVSTQAMYKFDPRLDVLTGLGLERSGFTEEAAKAYKAAFDKWLHLQKASVQHHKKLAEASLPAQLHVRERLRKGQLELARKELKQLARMTSTMSKDARRDALRFLAFASAYAESQAESPEFGRAMIRDLAMTTLRGIESNADAHYFTRKVLEYRDYFGSLRRGDGAKVLNKIIYQQAIESIVVSVRNNPWN